MRKIVDAPVARLSRDDGQTMAEYALLSSILLIAAVGAFMTIGPLIASKIQLAMDAFP